MLLYDMARADRPLWERRVAMVSTMAFIRQGELDDTFALAEGFLASSPLHDLLQKAVGWLLREAGKRDMERLRTWLQLRCADMPRTMLRYAVEKFPEEERRRFLNR